jgi:hypothetical protein
MPEPAENPTKNPRGRPRAGRVTVGKTFAMPVDLRDRLSEAADQESLARGYRVSANAAALAAIKEWCDDRLDSQVVAGAALDTEDAPAGAHGGAHA